MYDKFDRKFISTRKKAKSSTALYLGIAGGAFALIAVVGVVLFIVLKKPGEGGFGFLNSRVTEDNYIAVKDGADLAEVEAILGRGRPPADGDFDAIFGTDDERNMYMQKNQQRGPWVENHRRGLVLAWNGGKARMLVVFTQPPDKGGRVIGKVLLKADGSVTTLYGTGQPEKPAPSPAQPPPDANATRTLKLPSRAPTDDGSPPTRIAPADLLAEFAADRAAAMKKYQGRKVTLTGPASDIQQNVFSFQAASGTAKVSVTLITPTNVPEPNLLKQKKNGDTLTVTATVRFYFADTNLLIVDHGNLDN